MAPKKNLVKEVNRPQAHMCLSPSQRPVFCDQTVSAEEARHGGLKLQIVLLPSGNLCFEYRR